MTKRGVPDMRAVLYGARGAEEQTGTAAAGEGGSAAHAPTSPAAVEPVGAAAQAPSIPTAHVQTRRTGSLRTPYERKDGRKIANVTFSLPVELAKEIRVFIAHMDPHTRNEWAAEWLRRGMRG